MTLNKRRDTKPQREMKGPPSLNSLTNKSLFLLKKCVAQFKDHFTKKTLMKKNKVVQ